MEPFIADAWAMKRTEGTDKILAVAHTWVVSLHTQLWKVGKKCVFVCVSMHKNAIVKYGHTCYLHIANLQNAITTSFMFSFTTLFSSNSL